VYKNALELQIAFVRCYTAKMRFSSLNTICFLGVFFLLDIFSCASNRNGSVPASFRQTPAAGNEFSRDSASPGGNFEGSALDNAAEWPPSAWRQDSKTVSGAGLTGEIRALVEKGSPGALRQALRLIRENNIANTEFGRVMASVAVVLLDNVYGEAQETDLAVDFPQTSRYGKIVRDTENGLYLRPVISSEDYLELTLPFLALLNETKLSKISAALPDLEKARRVNPGGVLAAYFLGLVYERVPRLNSAAEEYSEALSIAPDCYAASLGLARVLSAEGRRKEAVDLLAKLDERYYNNMTVKRQLAFVYIKEKMLDEAAEAIRQALSANPRDAGMLLLQARYLIEKGQAVAAQFPLDAYIQTAKENSEYLLLRSRIAAEGFNNKDAAISQMRPLLRVYPNDLEIQIYLIKLLLESAKESENKEGKAMLSSLLKTWAGNNGAIPYSLIELAMNDALRREEWNEAKKYREQMPEAPNNANDLLYSYEIEHGLGNNSRALSYAQELYEKHPNNEEGVIAYATALIDSGKKTAALRIINERIAGLGAGSFKSRYYFLRSRLEPNGEAALPDLRSALFENPRNLDAILSMFQIYDKNNDERRAVYYLKQAAALSPNHPVVKQALNKKYAGKI
jgi:Tfp pilus assembly protein PilF